jgi:hypothetical protein
MSKVTSDGEHANAMLTLDGQGKQTVLLLAWFQIRKIVSPGGSANGLYASREDSRTGNLSSRLLTK